MNLFNKILNYEANQVNNSIISQQFDKMLKIKWQSFNYFSVIVICW